MVRPDQEIPVLVFFEYERKRALNRALYGGQRVPGEGGHAVLDASDGIPEVAGQALGRRRQAVGLSLRGGAVEGGTQGWEEGRYQG
jgi:hypothetical protein